LYANPALKTRLFIKTSPRIPIPETIASASGFHRAKSKDLDLYAVIFIAPTEGIKK